jgi:hypothetical protein
VSAMPRTTRLASWVAIAVIAAIAATALAGCSTSSHAAGSHPSNTAWQQWLAAGGRQPVDSLASDANDMRVDVDNFSMLTIDCDDLQRDLAASQQYVDEHPLPTADQAVWVDAMTQYTNSVFACHSGIADDAITDVDNADTDIQLLTQHS